LKLAGEIREITAFFTDVEGFTAMTDRAGPHQLIDVLDDYFDAVSRIVVDHGGLVDKIVGDAVHAIFNAPFDLPDHPMRALECARAIEAFSRDFRTRDLPKALGFGITRIGFETGPAIVGDVGGSRKLDYTAHGNAMNAAARLEAANKELGTTIAIGAGAAARLPAADLRPLGLLKIRGRSEPQAVYTIWSAHAGADDRDRLRRAASLPPNEAIQALQAHIAAHPGDTAARLQVARLEVAVAAS
jgi:adenylate cyclase